MIDLVKVVEARAVDGHRLWVRFTDGTEGIRDFSGIIAEGGAMVDALRDEALFKKVFVTFGVPTWPNGFDVDAVALHQELSERRALKSVAA